MEPINFLLIRTSSPPQTGGYGYVAACVHPFTDLSHEYIFTWFA